MTDSETHWEIVDHIADLVVDVAVDSEHVDSRKVDWFIGQDAELLNRALVNYAASTYQLLCEVVGIDSAESRLQTAILIPLSSLQLISTMPVLYDQALHDLYIECAQPKNTTGPLQMHLSYELGSVSPSSLVLNGFFPVIFDLVAKMTALQPAVGEGMPGRPIDPRADGSRLRDVQADIRNHIGGRVGGS